MMLVPLYIHPLDDPDAWEPAHYLAAGATVVVNVHDGPGSVRDDAYLAVTQRLHRAGVPMLGYVDLDYANRLNGAVWRDIIGWAPYRVGGIFFDRVPSDEASLDYVGQAVRAVAERVVLNPGTSCPVGYSAVADLVCTFEGPWSAYLWRDPTPDWPNAAHLVYGVPAGSLDAAQALVRSRVGHGLATDLDAPLPYAGVPASLRQPAGAR